MVLGAFTIYKILGESKVLEFDYVYPVSCLPYNDCTKILGTHSTRDGKMAPKYDHNWAGLGLFFKQGRYGSLKYNPGLGLDLRKIDLFDLT